MGMKTCKQYKCNNTIEDDAIDHKCFFCREIFCDSHIGDYPAGTMADARKRIEDVRAMDLDDEYLENLEDELEAAEELGYDEDEVVVFSHIMIPVCECCAERLSEKSEQWKGIIEKVT